MLASASVDNNIIVWDCRSHMTTAQNTGGHGGPSNRSGHILTGGGMVSPFRVLSGHQSFVKGVSFDPVGRFLASSGGDNLIIIWDCDTWEALYTLDGPLKHSVDRTMFRRLSWAPDGSALCVTCATKSSKPVGMVLKRGTWESVADLVGHSTSSTCCKFCPVVLTSSNSSDSGSSSSSSSAGGVSDSGNASGSSSAIIAGSSGNKTSKKGPGTRASGASSCCVALGDQHGLVREYC